MCGEDKWTVRAVRERLDCQGAGVQVGAWLCAQEAGRHQRGLSREAKGAWVGSRLGTPETSPVFQPCPRHRVLFTPVINSSPEAGTRLSCPWLEAAPALSRSSSQVLDYQTADPWTQSGLEHLPPRQCLTTTGHNGRCPLTKEARHGRQCSPEPPAAVSDPGVTVMGVWSEQFCDNRTSLEFCYKPHLGEVWSF